MKITFTSNKYNDLKPETKKPIIPGLVVLSVLIIGTTGYHLLWMDKDSDIIDALYMTLITMSTIGYSEIYPLDNMGRIFTMILAITGIGSLFYVLSIIMENLFILQLHDYRGRKKKMKEIEKLENHIILVGYGRVGQLSARVLSARGEKFVVIDDHFIEEDAVGLDSSILKVIGDGTEDKTLKKAGIERAKGIIVATGSASTNVFVVLSAKVLNHDLFIVARSDEDTAREKLKRAGADRVVNPYSTGGQRLANLMINTNIVDFLETSFGIADTLKIENVNLPPNCLWFEKTLKEVDFRRIYGVTILAVIRDKRPYKNPGGNFLLKDGDQLIIMGEEKELKDLEDKLLLN